MYIGTYKGEIEIYDEATEKMVDKIAAQDRDSALAHAVAGSHALLRAELAVRGDRDHRHRLAQDHRQLQADRGNKHIRVNSLQPDPSNKFLILLYRTATKLVDRWEIGPPTIQQYDLTTHQFTRTIPWPKGEERESVNMRLGPDGKHLFIFGDEVTVLETANFTEVESWPFAAPTEPGLGRINLGPSHDFYDPPGHLHRPLHACPTRCRTGGSWASAASTCSRKVDFHAARTGAPVLVRQVARRQARLRTRPGHRPLRVVDLRPRRRRVGAEAHRVRGPAAHGRHGSAPTASCSTSTSPAPRSTSTTPRPTSTCARCALDGDQTTELFVVPAARPTTTAGR